MHDNFDDLEEKAEAFGWLLRIILGFSVILVLVILAGILTFLR